MELVKLGQIPLVGFGGGAKVKNQLWYTEPGYVAYQIKGNETYDNIHANS